MVCKNIIIVQLNFGKGINEICAIFSIILKKVYIINKLVFCMNSGFDGLFIDYLVFYVYKNMFLSI